MVLSMVCAGEAARRFERGCLRPYEAGFVLQVPLRVVRDMLARGELTDVASGRRRGIAVEELARLVANRPLAIAALEAIAAGRLRVRRPESDAQPLSLMESWNSLW